MNLGQKRLLSLVINAFRLLYPGLLRRYQVFINLLNNAIKYSPQVDKVDVTIIAGEDKMTVSIRDYGVGIPSADQPKIFERFYRVLDSGEKKVSGLGMGLYIVHEIV